MEDMLSMLIDDIIYPRVRIIINGLLYVTDKIAGYKEGDSGSTQVHQAARQSADRHETDYTSVYTSYNANHISNYYHAALYNNLQFGRQPGAAMQSYIQPWGGAWNLDSEEEEMMETRNVSERRAGKQEKKAKRTLRSRISSAFRTLIICGPKNR